VNRLWRRSVVRQVWREGAGLELLHRAMSFAALGLVTLVPLLIVVAAVVPFRHRGFALWLIDGMGLSSQPSAAVQALFTAPRRVLSTTSAVSLAAASLFGLTFASSVQSVYEKIWSLPAGRWHSAWRQAVWLAGLTAYLFVEAQSGAVLWEGWVQAAVRIMLTVVVAVLFFWWGQHLMLGGRVDWRALLPGAVATVVGLAGLRGFSSLVFSPLIDTEAVSYGAVGTVLIVQSWLIGVGFVVYGGALLGRHLSRPPARSDPGDPSS
jgi:membrane protein